MEIEPFTLTGKHIRLEPLGTQHKAGLAAAFAASDPSLYQWATVPKNDEELTRYIDSANAWRKMGHAMGFATIRLSDETVIGSTRFFAIEQWAWPKDHPRHGMLDGCEIGYTWLAASALRTPVNTEAKLMMLTHAFEVWKLHRVCFHTDVRNKRSAAALERIGAKQEGVLRAHRLAVDLRARDSLRYTIIAAEWPDVKTRLVERLR